MSEGSALVSRPTTITLHLDPREDGGLRVYSNDLPGLILSHSDQMLVLKDIGPALVVLLRRKDTLDGQ